MRPFQSDVPRRFVRLLLALVCLALPTVATLPSHAVDGFLMETRFTVSGDLSAGSVATLNIELANVGTADYPYDATAWLILPKELKRTNVPAGVLCESYRGHQGGLSQSVYNDFCRWTFKGPIPAGGSAVLAFPIKLLAEGTYNTQTETASGVPYTDVCCSGVFYPNLVRKSLTVTVTPAVKAGGGGGGGGTTTALPDLQTTAKASTGSPAIGTDVAFTFTTKNGGKADATGVTISATVDPSLTITAASAATGACTVTANVATCPAASVVPVGGSLSMTVSARPTIIGTFSAMGAFAAANGDSNPANDAAAVSVTVKG